MIIKNEDFYKDDNLVASRYGYCFSINNALYRIETEIYVNNNTTDIIFNAINQVKILKSNKLCRRFEESEIESLLTKILYDVYKALLKEYNSNLYSVRIDKITPECLCGKEDHNEGCTIS
jgi:hypothetical protein